MKKIILSLLICIISLSFYSQSYTVVAKAQSSTELITAKNNGIFKFTYPASVTKDQITSSANYYINYFTVQYNETDHSVVLTMLNNTAENRRVIMRFLMSSRLQKIKVDDNELFIQDFYDQHLD